MYKDLTRINCLFYRKICSFSIYFGNIALLKPLASDSQIDRLFQAKKVRRVYLVDFDGICFSMGFELQRNKVGEQGQRG